jgi:C4-dicarboxylate-specific signal transduction histidine kinase
MAAALWNQWQSDRAAAAERAIYEARLLAAQVDDYIGSLDNLLSVLAQSVSFEPADRSANEALLRKVHSELPHGHSHILLFDADGTKIGTAQDPDYPRPYAHGRAYFQEAMAGHTPAVGMPILVQSGRLVLNVARPITDASGRIRAVLTVGPVLDHFEDALKVHTLPPNSAISIVNLQGVVITANREELTVTRSAGAIWNNGSPARKAATFQAGPIGTMWNA